MQKEKWLPVVGYEGLYIVSDAGNVRRAERVRVSKNGVVWKLPERPCKLFNNGFGYTIVSLHKNSIQKTKTVHRLVALSFIRNEEGKKCVNHKNGVRHDNRVENLEWCTHSENAKHAFDVLNRDKRIGEGLGKDNTQAVPIKCVQTNKVFGSIIDAAKEMNMPLSTVYKAVSSKRTTKNGYSFIRLNKR